MTDPHFTKRADLDAWAAMEAWCVKRNAALRAEMDPYIMRGGDLNTPDYRRKLGEAAAYGHMRSFIHGCRVTLAQKPDQ